VTTLRRERDLAGITLAVAALSGLAIATYVVLRPFLGATIWASTIVVATWPLLLTLEKRFGGRRWVAVLILTTASLLLLIVPLLLAISTIVENAGLVTTWFAQLGTDGLPSLPSWVGKMPFGDRVIDWWAQVSATGRAGILAQLQPHAQDAGEWVLARLGSVGSALVQFLLTVAITAILYFKGESAAAQMKALGARLAGPRGRDSVVLAGNAIRGVALAIVVTALVQAVLGGLGLALAGLPFVSVLTALMFLFCLAQVGPLVVLLPAVGWMYFNGSGVAATVLLVWSLVVGLSDNVLRPLLMKRGANLPMLLTFVGVMGGLIAMGMLGIFVGPVVLAVTYTLLESWVQEDGAPHEQAPALSHPLHQGDLPV
jgi:predicted PurR-regulated permease PerM